MSQIITCTGLDMPELDAYARLTEHELRSKAEPEKGIFIAESPKVIRRALDAGMKPLSFLMEERHINGQGAALMERCPNVPVYTGSREVLAGITGYQLTRGILCAMKRPELPRVEDICKDARRIAVLEGITDTTNLGAIFRSAAALGMDAVLVSPTCCDPLLRRAVRVSMGTVFQVPWTRIGELPEDWPLKGQMQLHELGFKTAALALTQKSVSVRDAQLAAEEKLALILGTEGDGLQQQTIDGCDYTVLIPMTHGVDSLNVAAAAAVAFWQLGGSGL